MSSCGRSSCGFHIAAVLLCALLAAVTGPVAAADASVDLRLLVDVSGSMKKNDPRNLRAPAVRLLVGLLPASARAGIWTFGQQVNEVLPVAAADGKWKARARAAAREFRSNEMYTDIEQALRAATADWKAAATPGKRYLILLTDGMVDVGEAGAGSVASRERIRREILPDLKARNVVVHTVALSANADRKLLEALSRSTGGWFEQADSAERLNRVFLRLFEKTAPPETLPIDEGNRFTVDDQVSDMTLLVFRSSGAMSSHVVTPAGDVLSSRNPLPDNVRWAVEQAYDLVTITAPAPGRWRIDAETDPDNRVMVVTNLKLELNPLPNHVIQDGPIPVVAWLTKEGGRLTDQGFLGLVDFSAAAGRETERMTGLSMQPLGEPGDYAVTVNPGLGEGTLVIEVVADGGTFARRQRHEVRVHEEPASIELIPGEGSGPGRLRVTLADGLMDLNTAQLVYRALDHAGSEPVGVRPEQPGVWQFELPPELAGGMFEVRLEATRVDGEAFQMSVERLAPGSPPPLPPLPKPPADPLHETEFDWPMVWIWVGVANLVLWPLAGLGWWLWRRQRAKRRQAMAEVLG